jgi:hypothetical protein
MFWEPSLNYWICIAPHGFPVAVTMSVAYLTADLGAVTSIFSDPDRFVKADPFPYFICALIVLSSALEGFQLTR